jgi:hypothetical protein
MNAMVAHVSHAGEGCSESSIIMINMKCMLGTLILLISGSEEGVDVDDLVAHVNYAGEAWLDSSYTWSVAANPMIGLSMLHVLTLLLGGCTLAIFRLLHGFRLDTTSYQWFNNCLFTLVLSSQPTKQTCSHLLLLLCRWLP